ncbi:uncharacterized protein LOC132381004 isoform X2 [Hypanus sabinus]|uniref:uncharacterized protein LOC132381004 isoform X2 n=1 Tax=Hypanus sabinus TaxID=79690 RepID=UPI0028C40033|nr:uncharacterized protein LOC132381004 isoform X2 [Hypanus sabinus]
MDVDSRRFLQSKPGGCALRLNVPFENRNQREIFELNPRRRARAENGSTRNGREMEQDSARTAHSAVSEMKDCTPKGPAKSRGNDGHRSQGKVHPACCDKKGSSPTEKSKRPPHYVQESAGAVLDPDVTAEDSMSISSFPQLERTEASGRTGLQTVGVMPGEGSDAAPIPVRITPRAHEIWQTLGSFTLPQVDAVLPSKRIPPIELSDPEPREKRKKTATASNQLSDIWGADSVLDKEKIRGDAGVNRKKHEPGAKRPENRFPTKDEEISKGADSVLDKEKIRRDAGVNRKKHVPGGKRTENLFPTKCEEISKGADSVLDKEKIRGDAGVNRKKHVPGGKRPENRFPTKDEEISKGADSVLDKEKIRGDVGVNWKKHMPGGKRPENRFPTKDEEISKGADSVLDKEKIRGDAGVNRKKHEPGGKRPENRFSTKDEEISKKRESHKSPGNIRDGGHHSSSSGSMAGSTGWSRTDDLAGELSRSSALSERERQKRQRHREKRSAAILAKRDKLMKIYKMDCEAFATVAKQLIAQDASLEERVASAVKKSLRLIGERCLAELKGTIAKWDAANLLKKRR